MSTDLAIPDPASVTLTQVRTELIPAVQATREIIRQSANLGAAQDLARRLEAYRTYLTDREGRDLIAAEARRTEILIGQLLGPGTPGERTDLSPAGERLAIPREDRHRFRVLAANPEAVEQALAAGVVSRGAIIERITRPPAEPQAPPHVSRNTGENEWYTPAEYITAATAVLGAIDLDPASTELANTVVKAAAYYTEADDGLTKPWAGRVWLNPPYHQPACSQFCGVLAIEYRTEQVTEAIALVNNGTETAWFQELAADAAAICFPRGRVKFWHPVRESAPLQGQAVIYLGPDPALFRKEFGDFGIVVAP